MNVVFCAVFSLVFLVVFCTTRRYSMNVVFYEYSHTYSFGFSCILDEVKKCTDFAYFLAGGWGGGGSDPRIPYSGVRREYMVFSVFWPYSVSYSTESQNTQNTDRIRTMYSGGQNTSYSLRILCILFWWTEYRILSKKQNTDRIRTEYGQNTVITKRAIVITNRTPPDELLKLCLRPGTLTR